MSRRRVKVGREKIPPSAPSNLLASPLSSSQISLTWGASIDTGGSGLAGYRLYRGGVLSSVLNPASTSFVDSSLLVGTTYSYYLTAYDVDGNTSPQSNTAQGTTQGDVTAPSVPTNLAASAVSSSQINLTWTASTDNLAVTGYRLQRATDAAFSANLNTSNLGNVTSASATGLNASTQYWFRVAARDAAGNFSLDSSSANATTEAAAGTGTNIWDGSFDGGRINYIGGAQAEIVPAGRFRQWHDPLSSGTPKPRYWTIPLYGRPAQQAGDASLAGYYGDGSLLWLVTDTVRRGQYAARFRVKDSPLAADYDGDVSTRRRTELNALPMPQSYQAIKYQTTHWFSTSYYFPSGFWPAAGSGWGPLISQIKTTSGVGSPAYSILVNYRDGNYRWQIRFLWNPHSENDPATTPWWQQMLYDYQWPATGSSWSSCVADFPLGETSRAALSGLQFDTWIDWVFQVRPDARGAGEGGQGFFKAWKRVGNGPWVYVLNITPKVTSAGGYTFDHGIWKRSDAGYGPTCGMYMENPQVIGVGERQLVIDNWRVGDANCTFSQMSPDGSAP